MQTNPTIDVDGILKGKVGAPELRDRIRVHTGNILADFEIKIREIGYNDDIESIIDDIDGVLLEYVSTDKVGRPQVQTDSQILQTFGAGLLIVCRERTLPITISDITELINQNITPQKIIDEHRDNVRVKYDPETPQHIILSTVDPIGRQSHIFRIATESGETPSETEIMDIIGGKQSDVNRVIHNMVEYIATPTVEGKHIASYKRKMDSMAGELRDEIDPEHYVDRLVTVLGLSETTREKANEILTNYTTNTRQSIVLAATAVWVASEAYTKDVYQQDIIEEAGISGAAIRKAKSDIKQDSLV